MDLERDARRDVVVREPERVGLRTPEHLGRPLGLAHDDERLIASTGSSGARTYT
jgi:hypothetical protein